VWKRSLAASTVAGKNVRYLSCDVLGVARGEEAIEVPEDVLDAVAAPAEGAFDRDVARQGGAQAGSERRAASFSHLRNRSREGVGSGSATSRRSSRWRRR
jgi:hypothetical protein